MSIRNEDPNRFELANGITLTLRDASPALIVNLRTQAEADKPQVPMITREDRDGRQEPNEDDPAYRAAEAKWVSATGWRTLTVLATACVTVDQIPDGIPGPETEDWAALVTTVYGFDLEDNALRRMAQWLLLQTTADDLIDLGPLLMTHAGVDEKGVQDALDSFRRFGGRPADTAGASNGSRADGDTVTPAPTGTRAPRRRAASR